MGRWCRMASLKTPYADLLPLLSTEEYEALKADIKANGVQFPVMVDEVGNILDGHNRYSIDKNAPTVVVSGLSDAQKLAFVVRMNMARRNLSPAQRKELLKKMKAIAAALRKEDAKRWTQKAVAKELGVARETVSAWWNRDNASNGASTNTCTPTPDARVKINPAQKPLILQRVAAGETQAQVAADYKVTPQAISSIVKSESKKAEVAAERQEAAKKRTTNNGVIHGDFRQGGDEPESFDLIFTDPPYDEKAASLYHDLAEYAARTLVNGGWVLAYSGQQFLPEVYAALSSHGLVYAWTFCIVHSDGDLRFRKYKVHNGWKPIVAAYKPKLAVDWEWFKDVFSGGKEKDDHKWQQSVDEAKYFIERLCPKYGTVCDPFCGSGTTLLAAKGIERKWLGYDADLTAVDTARSRLDD